MSFFHVHIHSGLTTGHRSGMPFRVCYLEWELSHVITFMFFILVFLVTLILLSLTWAVISVFTTQISKFSEHNIFKSCLWVKTKILFKDTRWMCHTESTNQRSQELTETNSTAMEPVYFLPWSSAYVWCSCGTTNSGSKGCPWLFCLLLRTFSSYWVASSSLIVRVCA